VHYCAQKTATRGQALTMFTLRSPLGELLSGAVLLHTLS
jgi:hypothetical protein